MGKSTIVGINVDPSLLQDLATQVGCEVGEWPIKYLGLPLGGNPLSVEFWNPVIEKVSKRLDGWKKAFLSRGGRLTLIQSVLASIPIYYMSIFRMPKSVVKILEKLMRVFLWDAQEGGKVDNLVAWDLVIKCKAKGGLGIGNLKKKNIALLGKWLWRFPLEQNSLWGMVVRSKYGLHPNGWDSNLVTRGSFRNPWKYISQGIDSFFRFVKWEVGRGNRIRFWEDVWRGDQPFAVTFPRLFRLSNAHNIFISDFCTLSSTHVNSWNFSFRRNLNDREVEELSSLLGVLGNFCTNPLASDKRKWSLDSSGFSCKSYFHAIIDSGENLFFEPSDFIWKSSVPYRVKVFAWLVFHRKLNTCEVLQRKNPYWAISPSWCVLCKEEGETVDHLFLHCKVTRGLWIRLLQEAGFSWVFPKFCGALMVEKPIGFGTNNLAKVMWKSVVLSLLWVIWIERNNRIFEDKVMSSEDLFEKAKYLAALWASTDKAFKDFPFSLIVLNWKDVTGG